MIIRKLTDADIPEHEKLAALAFICETDPYEEGLTLPCEDMLGAFSDDGRLIADMEVGKRQNFYYSSLLSCIAVGGVSSRPEVRRSGSVRALFEKLFEDEDRENGAEISILYPFSNTYYRKFGYEFAGETLSVTLPFSELCAERQEGSAELFEGNDPEELLNLYNSSAAKTCLAFRRENAEMFNCDPYRTAKYTYIWRSPSGEAKAYASFIADRRNSVISVRELNYLDKEGLSGILGFLQAYKGNYASLRFEGIPADFPVPHFISDMHGCEIRYSYPGAVRILDVESVLKKKRFPVSGGSFTLKCRDTMKKNNDIFHVEYENGKAVVERGGAYKPDIELEPHAFSRLILCGVNNAEELEYLRGAVITGNAERIASAFVPEKLFFNDSF